MKRFFFNSIFALIALMCFQSCLTDKKIAANCERFYEVCGTPEKVIEYRDTTVYIHRDVMSPAPKDSIHATVGLIVDSVGNVSFGDEKDVSFSGQYVKSDLKIINNKLVVDTYVHADSIPISIDMQVNLPGAIKEIKDTNVIPIKYIPKAYEWSFNFLLSLIIAFAIYLAFKFNLFGFGGWVTRILGVIKKFF